MPLSAGTRLGPYEILTPLGAGGMGEVYRARDTRLDRSVAIKVLQPGLAGDAAVRERFEREARVVSSLEHPHICPLYDVGRAGDLAFLVMQYLDGETLAARLATKAASRQRALPLEEALAIAIQIASALDEAHRRGVVHRDLKPGNVMLTASGAKLLDFGLASLQSQPAAGTGASLLPTRSNPLTGEGVILGTLQYMAPEQLEGRQVDHRTDIFAFGAVLYEMATGRRAFEGASQASVIAAILAATPPPPSSLAASVSPALDRAINKCLAKDPGARWQTARDLLDELRWIAKGASATATAAPAPAAVTRRPLVAVGAGLAAGILLMAAAWRLVLVPGAAPSPVIRFSLTLPAGLPAGLEGPGGPGAIAISPDGRRLAYVLTRPEGYTLHLRALDRFEDQPVEGVAAGAYGPFFSPDGEWVAYFGEGRLRKAPVAGGPPVTVCELPGRARGGSWGADGTIVFAAWPGLFRVRASGGTPEPITSPDAERGELAHEWPQILPGTRHVLFIVRTGMDFDHMRAAVLSLQDGAWQTVVEEANYARYLPGGYLVYTWRGAVKATQFDVRRLRLTGDSATLLEGVALRTAIALGEGGSLVYRPLDQDVWERFPAWIDSQDRITPVEIPRRAYSLMGVSPDGGRAVLTMIADDRRMSLWMLDLRRQTSSRLPLAGNNHLALWSPDGIRVAYTSDRDGPANIYWQPADGSSPAERLLTSPQHQDAASFSPDGRLLSYAEVDPRNDWDIWVLSLDGDRKPQPFRRTPHAEYQPIFSPDGRWLAYTSEESGAPEVYVEPFPGPGQRVQASIHGGWYPLWSADGRILYYQRDDTIFAVDLDLGANPLASEPRKILGAPLGYRHGFGVAPYAFLPDGRFFALLRAEEAAPATLNVVVNWAEELKAVLGSGR